MERLNNQPVIIEQNALEPVTTFYVEQGNTISEILAIAKIPEAIYPNVVIIMNGIEISQEQWSIIEPRDDDILGLHIIPLGGDGAKGILRMVALIAVAIAIPQLALNVGALTTVNAAGVTVLNTAGMFAVAGATLVASLAINAIIPPPKPATVSQSAAGDSYFINSQTNRARLNETIPVVYGMHKMFGNLATAPSIFSAGTSSVFTALYDWGLGDLDVWALKAGDTPLSKFGGKIRHLKNIPNHYDPEQPDLGLEPVNLEMINYPTKSVELNVGLNKNGDTATPTTANNSKSAVLEFTFAGGLVKFDKKGKEQRLSVQFNAQMRKAGSGNQWVNLPSGSRGYAGDHFQISGGFLGNDFTKNPNEPASVTVSLDSYAITSGTKVFVRLRFNQPTYFVRPQDDLWFIDAETSIRTPAFDFNETPNPLDYPPEWVLVTGDQPAKGVFVINEGREYGFEFLTNGVKNGYYLARTDLANFKDAPPPSGFSFPAGVVNSEQLVVGDESNGDIVSPPISDTLYSQTAGNETYLRLVQTQAMTRRDLARWTEIPSSAQLFYLGTNLSLDLALVGEYKGQLKQTDDPQENYGGVKTRIVYYALKVAPSNTSSYGIGTSPAFNYNPEFNGDFVTRSSFNISGNELTAGKVSLVVPFAEEGTYEFKVTRSGDHENYTGDDRFVERCTMTRITSRGYPADQIGERRGILNLKKKHTMTEVQFTASENIQGSVQQINAMARSYLRWHKDGQWQEPTVNPRVSSNPAWIVLDILTGYSIQNAPAVPSKIDFDGGWITDAQIDFVTFKHFADHCNETVEYLDKYGETQTRYRYQVSMVLASEAPIAETVNNILSMCRAQLIMNQQGQVSVMLDSNLDWSGNPKTPRQLFTSHNSWNFNATRTFVDLPHCFKVSFTDPDLGYQNGVIEVYRPEYDERNSTLFEDLPTFGVTNWHQAAQYGRYMLAQGVMRSEAMTLSIDAESLVVQRGDIIELQHEAPIIGGSSAIVNSVSDDDIELLISEQFGQVNDAGYTLRTATGDIFNGSCVAVGNKITLDQPRPAGAGDVIVVGTKNKKGAVTQKYIVREITPKADLTAELSLSLFDENVYLTDDDIFPTYDPNFGSTDSESGYHTVTELDGFSYLAIEERQPYTVATMNWRCSPLDDGIHRFIIDYIKTGSIEKQFVTSVSATSDSDGLFTAVHKYSNSDPRFGSGIYFVTPLSTLGYLGKPQELYLSKVYDRTIPNPPAPFYVDRLTVSDAMRFRWMQNYRDNDIEGFVIYKMPPSSSTFDISVAEVYQQIDDKRVNSWEDILIDAVFWIVSVDTSGNESVPVPETIYWELKQVICGDPSWPDEKVSCQRVVEELVIDNNVPITEHNGVTGRHAFYAFQETTSAYEISNFAVRTFIETSTNLDSVVLADEPPWNPMANVDPLSWQPDGMNYEVFFECSVDGGEFQRFHNKLFRGQQLIYRLVLSSYKDNQDLRVQRACLYIYGTENLVVSNEKLEQENSDDE